MIKKKLHYIILLIIIDFLGSVIAMRQVYATSSFHMSEDEWTDSLSIEDVIELNGGWENVDDSDMEMTGDLYLNNRQGYISYDLVYSRISGIHAIVSPDPVESSKDAFRTLMMVREIFSIPEKATFSLEKKEEEQRGTTYIFDQSINGVSVEGGYFQIISCKSDPAIFIFGKYVEGIPDGFDTNPKLTIADIIKINAVSINVLEANIKLAIIETDEKEFVLSWCIQESTMENPLYYSASNGELLKEEHSIWSVDGKKEYR